MAFPKMTAPQSAAKGLVRCFKCRVRTTAKNGLWEKTDTQSIFLCKDCGATFRSETLKGTLSPAFLQKAED